MQQDPRKGLAHLRLKELQKEQPGRIQSAVGSKVEDRDGKFILDCANLTLFSRKAWSMLASLEPECKPSGFAFVETRLMGSHLNCARKRLRKMGWKALTTPAVPKLVKEAGRDVEGAAGDDESEGTYKKF